MVGKEKLKAALNHKEAPLLIDIGGMPTTGMHCITVEKMREFYGLEKRPVLIQEPMQMLGYMEDDLKQAMGIQTEPLWNAGTMFGFRQTDQFKEWRTPWGQDVLVAQDFETDIDRNGDVSIYACGDKNYAPSALMPKNGFYFDSLNRATEFDEDNYDVRDNYEEFGPISEADLNWLQTKAAELKSSTDVITGNLGGTAFGDIALVPGPQLKLPKGIRDITEWYISTAIRQDELHKIFSYQLEHAINNLEKMHKVLGDAIDTIYVCGNDLGTQRAPFCSNELFRELYAPYYRAVNKWVHENTSWKTFKHSCGSIFPLIEELIDVGFDILNPIQWTASDMDRESLKKAYGENVVFWGGGVDTQKTLPYGTSKQVYDEVLECCQIFGRNGGFVFNTIHNIQPGVPPENIAAMIDAVNKYNKQ